MASLETGNRQQLLSNKLMVRLSKRLCLECSTCAMFLSSSFTVSIMALFWVKACQKYSLKLLLCYFST